MKGFFSWIGMTIVVILKMAWLFVLIFTGMMLAIAFMRFMGGLFFRAANYRNVN